MGRKLYYCHKDSGMEGTYSTVNRRLVEEIVLQPDKYTGLFDNIPNLKILNYLSDYNRLDATPYSYEYALIRRLDGGRVFRRGLHAQ